MDYTMEDRANLIIAACKESKSTNPYEIFKKVASQNFVRIHGPEHHVLDGACILTAYYNAGGKIDLEESLQKLMQQGLLMPGAVCGLWGVCGAVMSVGASLAIIDGTGPLSTDGSWGNHMKFTSKALEKLAEINGPRCCKRDAYLSFKTAVEFINENYNVTLEMPNIKCEFSPYNEQCIGKRCPFHP
jgi:hypothetical protein